MKRFQNKRFFLNLNLKKIALVIIAFSGLYFFATNFYPRGIVEIVVFSLLLSFLIGAVVNFFSSQKAFIFFLLSFIAVILKILDMLNAINFILLIAFYIVLSKILGEVV